MGAIDAGQPSLGFVLFASALLLRDEHCQRAADVVGFFEALFVDFMAVAGRRYAAH
jgi:hypothetical protein